MDGTIIIEEIKKRMKFWGGRFPKATTAFIPKKRGDSWYLIQDRGKGNLPVRIRLSDHGTKLHNWTDREELGDSTSRIDPAYSINISIVFINEGENLTDDCKGQTNCEGCALPVCKPQTFAGQNEIGRPFKVFQYVYQSDTIAPRYINALTKAIFHARYSGEYIDPLKDLPRAAKPKEFDSTNLSKQKKPRYKQTENKQYKNNKNMNKQRIRLTESDLHRVIKESVKRVLNELSYKTLADAAAAAKDRESIFKDSEDYPYKPMRRTYKDDGSLNVAQYARDSLRTINQSKQPQKFKDAAYKSLSKELCGKDDFYQYIIDYVNNNGFDDYLSKLIQQYKEGERYIENNNTKWSARYK